jgi:hypothetical protein
MAEIGVLGGGPTAAKTKLSRVRTRVSAGESSRSALVAVVPTCA